MLLGLETQSSRQLLHARMLLLSISVHVHVLLTIHYCMCCRLESTVGFENLPVIGASGARLPRGMLQWLVCQSR